jgi:uncharacterized membrane protein YfcA
MGFGVCSASLLLAAGFSPVAAVATVNTAKILAGLFSGLAHWRAGNVRRAWLLPLIGPGIVGGVVGAHFLIALPPERVRFWMSAILAGMGILIVWRALLPVEPSSASPNGAPQNGETRAVVVRHLRLGGLGLVAGFLNALSGAYGPFATSAAMLASKAKPFRVVGTISVAEFFVASAVVTTFFFKMGTQAFPWGAVVALSLGGAMTAPLAAYVCRRLPPRVLVFCIGVILISLNIGVVLSWLK